MIPLLRDALAALEEHGEHALAAKLRAVYARKKSPPSARGYKTVTIKEARAELRRRHADETKAIRAAVMARAGTQCEACYGSFSAADPAEWDHLLRGAGVRRQHQSEATTWAIHRSCHRARTHNRPLEGHEAESRLCWPNAERYHLQAKRITPHPLIVRRWSREQERTRG